MKINPNRMELLKLKRRLAMAKRGHKLLKEKFDELIKHFFSLIKQSRQMRKELNDEIRLAHRSFDITRSLSNLKSLEAALENSTVQTEISYELKSLLNIKMPEFSFKSLGELNYSLVFTPANLDNTLESFNNLIPKIIELAEKENAVKLLASEIERTRRRVNALEHVLIPQLEVSSKSITMKLDELERDSHTRQLKVKEIVQA
ncbi:MAG: V-type ATP synthase subunit D [Actinobacteria bacterium]|nr:MAG: V-type ATP synthase subunit D [Actinomycetota bacterium]